MNLSYKYGFLTSSVAFFLASCAVGPDFERPKSPDTPVYTDTALPEKTAASAGIVGEAQSFSLGKDVPDHWWTLFNSEPLNTLVEAALANNPDLKAADASLRQAQENYYAARGEILPAVDASFSPTREKFNPSAFGQQGFPASIFTLYNASVTVSYGFDVFGGTRRAIEEAGALTEYQKYEQKAAYLTLVANVVTAAIQEASFNKQIKETQNIIDIENKQLGLLNQQLGFGAITKSSVLQQEATLAQTQANLPILKKQLAQAHSQLAVLAGNIPANNSGAVFELDTLKLPEELPVSLPSKLVERRPDILATEAQLHVASAAIGVATANMLPQFSLSGSYGSETTHLGKLFTPGAEVWNLGGNILQPLFRGGELLHNKRAAVAAYDKAAAQYESTVLLAFKNVSDTLRALQYDADGLVAQSYAAAVAKNSLELIQMQFNVGAISYPQLLDAEHTYQQIRIGLVQAQAARLADTVALFQALGGSVQSADLTPVTAPVVASPSDNNPSISPEIEQKS